MTEPGQSPSAPPPPDAIPKELVERVSSFIEFVKGWLKWIAMCIPLVTLICAIPAFRDRSTIRVTPLNPLFDVNMLQFRAAIRKNTALYDKIAGPLELGSKDDLVDMLFLREWYQKVGPFGDKMIQAFIPTDHEGQEKMFYRAIIHDGGGEEPKVDPVSDALGGVEIARRWLGYVEKRPELPIAKTEIPLGPNRAFVPTWAYHAGVANNHLNFFNADELVRDPRLISSIVFGGVPKSNAVIVSWAPYGDPFPAVFDKLDPVDRHAAYFALLDASRSYSPFIIENTGHLDAYDVRIAADIDFTQLDAGVLNAFGVYAERLTPSGQGFLKIPYLPAGKDNSRLLILKGTPEPVRASALRVDRKPFLEVVTDLWWVLLFFPLIPAFAEWRIRGFKKASDGAPQE